MPDISIPFPLNGYKDPIRFEQENRSTEEQSDGTVVHQVLVVVGDVYVQESKVK
jgi:hypothetical protein